MKPWLKTVLWLNLAVILALAIIYPQLMISPGPVITGHAQYETDCFQCHTPFLGARSEKCIACHKVDDIGLKTTKGLPITGKKRPVAFHQKLTNSPCVECHSDHEGVMVFRQVNKFTHSLLDSESLKQCASCHSRPADELHKNAPEDCKMCHVTDKWKPANFMHNLLPKDKINDCKSCHGAKTPRDTIHENASSECGLCHSTEKWKPASFKHETLPKAELRVCENCHIKKMPDDRIHNESSRRCKNCHTTNKWKPAKQTFKSTTTLPATPGDWWRRGGGDD